MALIGNESTSFSVTESSQVGDARRAIERVTERLGFDATRRGEVAIVVTELAGNLSRHATGGELVIREISTSDTQGVEILSIDRGPGIASLDSAIRDGYSTGGTPGTGLGAVSRLSTDFDAFSSTTGGTVILSRIYSAPLPTPTLDAGALGVVCLPKKGEQACGDAWHVERVANGRTLVIVADGLGHGLQAAEASRQAVRLFRENSQLPSPRIMQIIHDGLRSTRGAAVAIVELAPGNNEIRCTGVGNISASIVTTAASRSMISHNGTVGAEIRKIQEFTYPWPTDEALLVMNSDGLASQWALAKYPGLRSKHPSVIAGVLYRDFRRERDDVTVLVLRDGKKAV